MRPAAGTRLEHVQGLRGLALLVIVVYHCQFPPTGGFVALDVFFVISGYVIGGMLLREVRRTGRIAFGAFYLRRVRRLLPALALVVTTVAVLSALFESPFGGQRLTSHIGTWATVSLANVALYREPAGYFDRASEVFTLRHTWSLSVEEQFYLVFPVLLAIVLVRHRRRLRALTWTVLVVAALSLAVLAVLAYVPSPAYVARPQSAAYYLPFSRAWEFVAGALVAIWHVSRPAFTARTSRWVGASGAVLVVGAVVLFSSESESSTPVLLVPVVGTALVLAACRSGGPLARVLAWRPFTWTGDRSYGWYLWHWPLIVLARARWPDDRLVLLAAAALGLLVSAVTYRWVEQRFRYPRRDDPPRRQTWSGVRIAAVSLTVPLVATGVLGALARRDWNDPQIRAMGEQLQALPDGAARMGCPTGPSGTFRPVDVRRCTRGAGGEPIYLLGDSNAGQHAAGLLAVGDAVGRPVVLLWRPGCAAIDLTVRRPDYDVDGCDRYNDAVGAWLDDHPGGTVVVSDGGEYVTAADATLVAADGRTAGDADGKQALWQSGLTRTLTRLRAGDHDVVLLGLLAHPGGVTEGARARWDPMLCGYLTMARSVDACGITVALADEDDRQRRQLAAETAAAEAAAVRYVSLRRAVCPEGTCRTVRDGAWIYRDGAHLTNRMSLTLQPELAAAVSGGAAGQVR